MSGAVGLAVGLALFVVLLLSACKIAAPQTPQEKQHADEEQMHRLSERLGRD